VAFMISIDRLDANIEEITIGAWLKAEGDPVALGEPVVEIITDKITFEYESEAEGILRRIVAAEKSVVPVHYVIGVIAAADEALARYEQRNAALRASLQESSASGGASPASRAARSEGEGSRKARATPAARRRARELGVEIEAVAATVQGAVSVEDVERFAGL